LSSPTDTQRASSAGAPAAPALAKSLGIGACTAIVVGNMVGSGFYLSPSAMAPYGVLAILSWVVMGAGAVCLGLTFARLARISPATGGPYAYSRIGYGDFVGFLVAWGYWISIWASLPAIAVAFTGSLFKIVPAFQGNRPMAVLITIGVMWLVVLTNLRGVKAAGVVAEVTTYSKLVPFAAISLVGLFFIKLGNLSEFNPSGHSLLSSAATLAPLTMFAYLGLESATVPAGDVKDPARTIPRSTILGVSTAALLYVLGTTVVLGVVPREELVKSAAPFADAARIMWGGWAAGIVGVAVMISSLGALNGWTLLMGQVPMAAAQDRLFPTLFGRVSSRGVPAFSIIFSAILATALILVQAAGSAGFAAFYSLVVNLATMTAVVPYAFCALAVGLVAARAVGNGTVPRVSAVECIAFVFSLFTLYGCGAEAVLYGFLLLMLGIPVYVWQVRRQSAAQRKSGVSDAGGGLAARLPEPSARRESGTSVVKELGASAN
jgi:basic amino acid/polyamine antiporter, APA family